MGRNDIKTRISRSVQALGSIWGPEPKEVAAQKDGRFLLVLHRGARCGVHLYGRRLAAMLECVGRGEWRHMECAGAEDVIAAAASFRPDAIVFNYHSSTMGWANGPAARAAGVPALAIWHEGHQLVADAADCSVFDGLLVPDPTLLPRNPRVRVVPRFTPELRPPGVSSPELFTVGSFGFARPGHGFGRLCEMVDAQFDEACIRLNIAPQDDTALEPMTAEAIAHCRALVTKPGIRLEITTEFLEETALLDFLADNTLNALLDGDAPARGVTSRADYALACGRPLMISGSAVLRHLHGANPSIVADERSLRDIAADGIDPLRHHIREYAPLAAASAWETAIRDLLKPRSPVSNGPLQGGTDGGAFAIAAVRRFLPAVMEPRILALCDDGAAAATGLRSRGWRVDTIAPGVAGEGLADAAWSGQALPASYDLVLVPGGLAKTSGDVAFVRTVTDLLAPGGHAAFIVDLQPGAADRHSAMDLRGHLMQALPECGLVDPDAWDGVAGPAGWVFRKFPMPTLRHAVRDLTAVRSATPSPMLPAHILALQGAPYYGMFSQIGREVWLGDMRLYEADGATAGFLMFGPYIRLAAGAYDGTVAMRLGFCDMPPGTVVATIDLALEKTPQPMLRQVLRRDLMVGDYTFISCRFVLDRDIELFELRVHLDTPAPLAIVAAIAIRPAGAEDAAAPGRRRLGGRGLVSEEARLHETATGRWWLPDLNSDIVIKAMRSGEMFEPEIVAVAEKHIVPGTTVLDIGSNFGQMACAFARLTGPSGMVHAFEADPDTFELLQQNLAENGCGNVEAHLGAVWHEAGMELFYPRPDFRRFGSYGSYGINPRAISGRTVRSLTVDSLQLPGPVSFMKVDVQGSDLFAMEGARRLIARDRPVIIFEFEEGLQDEFKTSIAAYKAFIVEIGYEIVEQVLGSNYVIAPLER